ncbi:hypothetical protein E1258_28505, partial [Micromonospora sp. KC207]
GLCLVGVAGLGAWNVQMLAGAGDEARRSADGFLREVAAGDVQRAYERLCAQSRTRWSAVGFAGWVRTPPVVTGYEIVDVSVRTSHGRPTGAVRARLTRDGGAGEERTVAMVEEDGQWRICGDPF